MAPWLSACLATLVCEVPVVVLLYPGQRKKLLAAATVLNIVTNVALNRFLPRLPLIGSRHLLVGEALALVGEAMGYALVVRPRDWARAFLASGVGNLISFTLGGTVAAFLRGIDAAAH
jgi:hypothetical protein